VGRRGIISAAASGEEEEEGEKGDEQQQSKQRRGHHGCSVLVYTAVSNCAKMVYIDLHSCMFRFVFFFFFLFYEMHALFSPFPLWLKHRTAHAHT
jgi:hypothetical protein